MTRLIKLWLICGAENFPLARADFHSAVRRESQLNKGFIIRKFRHRKTMVRIALSRLSAIFSKTYPKARSGKSARSVFSEAMA